MRISRNKKRGFTMTELIITIAVIGIIAAIAIPSLAGYFRMAKLEQLNNYARTAFLASQSYFTSYTGGGNSLEDNEAYKNAGNKTPADTITPQLPPEADAANIHYLKYDTANKGQENPLRDILLHYVTDADIMDYSILIEYNAKTGIMLSAFVSEADEIGYSLPDTGDVSARSDDALDDKLMGYYGVDDTGELPAPLDGQDVEIELVNGDQLLYALVTVPDPHDEEYGDIRYTATVEAGKRQKIEFTAEDLRDAAFSVSRALEQIATGQKEHAICADPDLIGPGLTDPAKRQYAILLDSFSKYNAYDRAAPDALSISERYPDIPIGQIYMSLTPYDARGDELGARVFSNFEHSYFADNEVTSQLTGNGDEEITGIRYDIGDARHLNNIQYVSAEKLGDAVALSILTYRQTDDITVEDRTGIADAPVAIEPLGSLQGAYTAQKESGQGVALQESYAINGLEVATKKDGQVNVGLFETITDSGSVQYVTIPGAAIHGKATGGIVAGVNAGEISNADVSGEVFVHETFAGASALGGITGENNGQVLACAAGHFPTPGSAAGPGDDMAYARSNDSVVTSAMGAAEGTSHNADTLTGGVAGRNNGNIQRCVSIAQVQNNAVGGAAGGITGENNAGSGSTLRNSYNAGRVYATGSGGAAGGITGRNGGAIEHCYNTGRVNISGAEDAEDAAGTLKTTGQDSVVLALANGYVGGIAGVNRDTGTMGDTYSIGHVAYYEGTGVSGGVVGRDETSAAGKGNIAESRFVADKGGVTEPIGEYVTEANKDRESVQAIYGVSGEAPDEDADIIAVRDALRTSYDGTPWTMDDSPFVHATYSYEYSYIERDDVRNTASQKTPWERITPQRQGDGVIIRNGEALTVEFTAGASGTVMLDVYEINGAGGRETIEINLANVTQAQNLDTAYKVYSNTGTAYPISWKAEGSSGQRIYVLVLDAVHIQTDRSNALLFNWDRSVNAFRQPGRIQAALYSKGGSAANGIVSNEEHNMYALDSTAVQYQIANARHLYNVRYKTDGNFLQTADITMQNYAGNSVEITPAGRLLGKYDGQGRLITNLFVRSTLGNSGLFGEVGPGVGQGTALVQAEFTNVIFSNVQISSDNGTAAGAVAGVNAGGKISSVRVMSGTIEAVHKAGGIVGDNAGTIVNCSAEQTPGVEQSLFIKETVKNANAATPRSVGGIAGNNAGVPVQANTLVDVWGSTSTGGALWWRSADYYVGTDPAAAVDEEGYVYIHFPSGPYGNGSLWNDRRITIKYRPEGTSTNLATYECHISFLNWWYRDGSLPQPTTGDKKNYVRFRLVSGQLIEDGTRSFDANNYKVAGEQYTPLTPGTEYTNAYGGQVEAMSGYANGVMMFDTYGVANGAKVYIAFDSLEIDADDNTNDPKNLPIIIRDPYLAANNTFRLLDGSANLTVNGLKNKGASSRHFVEFTYNASQRTFTYSGLTSVEGFIASPYLGTVENGANQASFYVTNMQYAFDRRIGGIAGTNGGIIRGSSNGTITKTEADSYAEQIAEVIDNPTKMVIEADVDIGGIAGVNNGGIETSYNVGEVGMKHQNTGVGGITAANTNYVQDCYNAGTVYTDHKKASHSSIVGGVVGTNYLTVEGCYNTGRINVEKDSLEYYKLNNGYIGGVIGKNEVAGVVSACYNIGLVGKLNNSNSGAGGVIGQNENWTAQTRLRTLKATVNGSAFDRGVYGNYNAQAGFDNASTPRDTMQAQATVDYLNGLDSNAYNKGSEASPYGLVYPNLKNRTHETAWEDASPGVLSGLGTQDDPYVIDEARHLGLIAAYDGAGVYFAQTRDINMDGVAYTPVAEFEGNYNGGGYKITNLDIIAQNTGADGTGADLYAGLMGSTAPDAVISSLILEDVTVSAAAVGGDAVYAGALAGVNRGTIEYCEVRMGSVGAVVASGAPTLYVGGVTGDNQGVVRFCSNGTAVLADGGASAYAGGLAGSHTGVLENSYNVGGVAAGNAAGETMFGSLAGTATGTVTNSVYLAGVRPAGVTLAARIAGLTEEQIAGADMVAFSLLNDSPLGAAWAYVPESGYPYPVIDRAAAQAMAAQLPAQDNGVIDTEETDAPAVERQPEQPSPSPLPDDGQPTKEQPDASEEPSGQPEPTPPESAPPEQTPDPAEAGEPETPDGEGG